MKSKNQHIHKCTGCKRLVKCENPQCLRSEWVGKRQRPTLCDKCFHKFLVDGLKWGDGMTTEFALDVADRKESNGMYNLDSLIELARAYRELQARLAATEAVVDAAKSLNNEIAIAHDDPRIDWVDCQVDRESLKEFQSALSSLDASKKENHENFNR